MGRLTNRSFTLVEMLVVITIVSIMAALLLPSLQRALESGRGASCQNNLRQIGALISTYSDQERGYLPYIADYAMWPDHSKGGNVWYCTNPPYPNWLLSLLQPYGGPTAGGGRLTVCPSWPALYWNQGNYALNMWLFRYSQSYDTAYQKLAKIQKPSHTIFSVDSWDTPESGATPNGNSNSMAASPDRVIGTWATVHYRHSNFTEVLYADGHSAPYGTFFSTIMPWQSGWLTGPWSGGFAR